VLTPLIKFRACRDARMVTGDAMEVRGGAGYIEEFADARLVRDAHLGSIWEGTSNIVALDVLRAITREGSLGALEAHLARLHLATNDGLPGLREAATRSFALARHAAGEGGPVLARQAASALYHLTSASAMAWEAGRMGDTGRRQLAEMVLRHRLLPRDPMDTTDAPVPDSLLPDPAADAMIEA
jgi:acyl-CoA dehydrogenase